MTGETRYLSTRIACTIFLWLHDRKATSNWLLTISAFLQGTDKIDAAVKKAPGFSYWDTVMPPACESVIPRLVALKIIDSHREFYGVNITPPEPAAYDFLDRLKLVKDLPLHVVAKWCGTNPRSIWELNPGVDPSTGVLPVPDKRSPSGFPLRVPRTWAERFDDYWSRRVICRADMRDRFAGTTRPSRPSRIASNECLTRERSDI